MIRSLLLFTPLVLAPPLVAAERPAKAGLCEACHGADGRSRIVGTPHLAGQDQTYLREALRQYAAGERRHPAMRAAVGPLQPVELDALAAWYAGLPALAPTP